jgi:hypothetical protein
MLKSALKYISLVHPFPSYLSYAIYWLNLGDQSWKKWGTTESVHNSHFNEAYFCFL